MSDFLLTPQCGVTLLSGMGQLISNSSSVWAPPISSTFNYDYITYHPHPRHMVPPLKNIIDLLT